MSVERPSRLDKALGSYTDRPSTSDLFKHHPANFDSGGTQTARTLKPLTELPSPSVVFRNHHDQSQDSDNRSLEKFHTTFTNNFIVNPALVPDIELWPKGSAVETPRKDATSGSASRGLETRLEKPLVIKSPSSLFSGKNGRMNAPFHHPSFRRSKLPPRAFIEGIESPTKRHKPHLLEHLETWVENELQRIGSTAAARGKPEAPCQERLAVFRSALDQLIERFSTYGPVVSDIKSEFEVFVQWHKENAPYLEQCRADMAACEHRAAKAEKELVERRHAHQQAMLSLNGSLAVLGEQLCEHEFTPQIQSLIQEVMALRRSLNAQVEERGSAPEKEVCEPGSKMSLPWSSEPRTEKVEDTSPTDAQEDSDQLSQLPSTKHQVPSIDNTFQQSRFQLAVERHEEEQMQKPRIVPTANNASEYIKMLTEENDSMHHDLALLKKEQQEDRMIYVNQLVAYRRRESDLVFQTSSAKTEKEQMMKQFLASQDALKEEEHLREALSERLQEEASMTESLKQAVTELSLEKETLRGTLEEITDHKTKLEEVVGNVNEHITRRFSVIEIGSPPGEATSESKPPSTHGLMTPRGRSRDSSNTEGKEDKVNQAEVAEMAGKLQQTMQELADTKTKLMEMQVHQELQTLKKPRATSEKLASQQLRRRSDIGRANTITHALTRNKRASTIRKVSTAALSPPKSSEASRAGPSQKKNSWTERVIPSGIRNFLAQVNNGSHDILIEPGMKEPDAERAAVVGGAHREPQPPTVRFEGVRRHASLITSEMAVSPPSSSPRTIRSQDQPSPRTTKTLEQYAHAGRTEEVKDKGAVAAKRPVLEPQPDTVKAQGSTKTLINMRFSKRANGMPQAHRR
ncbi:hypothetical protein CYMTET_52660 [Cymbomonas tetramitiformis]|uniref:Translin-associated factor X-interacting protein 1 N-terminal domain-containing protein n=1 Tax=Cymbomonas tetramitiformis TaxID=36881 RepID=A0AAE0BKF8_9CHLO|nr:hypothetical protein CYMTET_52660 [Cymbomonas tetramitiformis]